MAFDDPATWLPWQRSPGYQILASLAWLSLLILAVCSLLPYLAFAHKLELAAHFRFQFALLCLLLPLFFLLLRQKTPLIFSLILISWNIWEIAPWYLPAEKPDPGRGQPLKVLMSNMLYSNPDISRLHELILHELPDVVIIVELNAEHVALMERLGQRYPHRLYNTSFKPAFGIGVWSRGPMDAWEVVLGPAGVPSIYASLQWDGQPLHLLATHPFPPVDQAAFTLRNGQYDAIARFLADKNGSIMLIGDLNVTPWSPYYRKLLSETGLYNARRGFGIEPTWPTDLPPALRIPIDHALLSPALQVQKWQTGPDLGSDHLPILLSIIRS